MRRIIWAAILSPAAIAPAGAETNTSLRLVILGTGTPNADPDRSGPALAVIADGQAHLIDAGTGIVRRAAAVCGSP